jgi:hypothetical protein
MRFYSHIRRGASVTYTQIMTRVVTSDIICIPTVIPKVMDPYILWRETANKETITKFTVRDKELDDSFVIQSNKPIHKILSAGADLHNEMK